MQWGNFSLATGVDYSTGKYGQPVATDILYVPLTGKYETGPWVFKLTVPWIQITGPANVIPDIGVIRPSTTTQRTTHSGLGDIVASVSRDIYAPPGGPLVDILAKIKFGTASFSEGLGTGENDYSLALEAAQAFGRVTIFGDAGYKLVGSPAGVHLDNVAFGSLGASYKIDTGFTAGAVFDLQQRSSPTGGPHEELTAYVSKTLSRSWKAQLYALKGFSTLGSPNWGGGATISYLF